MATILYVGTEFHVGQQVRVSGRLAYGMGVVTEIRTLNPMGSAPTKNANEPFPHIVVRVDGYRNPIRYHAQDVLDGKVIPTGGRATTTPTVTAPPRPPRLEFEEGDTIWVEGRLYRGEALVKEIRWADKFAQEPYPHVLVQPSESGRKPIRYNAVDIRAGVFNNAFEEPDLEQLLDDDGIGFMGSFLSEEMLGQLVIDVSPKINETTKYTLADGRVITVKTAEGEQGFQIC